MKTFKANTDVKVTDIIIDDDSTTITLSSLIDLTFTAYDADGAVIGEWSLNNSGGDVKDVTADTDDQTFIFNIETDITGSYDYCKIEGEITYTDTTLSDNVRNIVFDVDSYTFTECQ